MVYSPGMDDERMGRALKYALLLRFFWGGEGPGEGRGPGGGGFVGFV